MSGPSKASQPPIETILEPSKPSKLTAADSDLFWAIFDHISRRELNKLIDWDIVAEKMGLKKPAVLKRWSRLNIKMREDDQVSDTGETEAGADTTEETASEGEAATDGQKPVTKEAGGKMVVTKENGGKVAAKGRGRKAPVKNKAVAGKGKGAKNKVTWDSAKAEIAAEAETEGVDSDQDAY